MSSTATADGLAGGDGAAPMRRPASTVAAILIGVTAVLVFTVQPGYLQGLVDLDRISGAQAGYIAAAEMSGYAITMILLSFLARRLPWRPILMACALLQAGGNLACVFRTGVGWLCAARFLAGLGAGGLISLAFSAIAMSREPDRNFGFMGMWTLIYGAVGLAALPSLLQGVGLRGFHLIIAFVSVASLALIQLMPAGLRERTDVASGADLSRAGGALAVLSCFVFFVGCGMLWAFLSLIGGKLGIASQAVANALGLSQFSAIAGALTAGLIGSRFGRFKPLTLALVVCTVSSAALNVLGAGAASQFAALVSLFNFAWNFTQPVYLSTAASFDRRGRLVSQMAASQACGLAVGPFVGATLGGDLHVRLLVWVVATAFLAAVGLIASPFSEARRRDIFTNAAARNRASPV